MKMFTLQWHLTERCNLRCTHCYQNEEIIKNELTLDEKFKVVDDFVAFTNSFSNKVVPKITLTGGEPFIYKDLEALLEYISAYKHIRFSYLTNGTQIDDYALLLLKKYKPLFVQVSIDGDKETHDKIRGKGSFDKAIDGIKKIKALDIITSISFTAHKQNYKDIPKVVQIAKTIGVHRFWSDRLIPEGHAKNIEKYLFNSSETFEYVKMLKIESIKANVNPFSKIIIGTQRALQFLPHIDMPYSCTAGKRLLTLMPDGTVYPCRRLPVEVGNIKKISFNDIYHKNEFINKLQNCNTNDGCEGCSFEKKCNGGLKCLAYAITGSPFKKDPGCWR